MNYLAIVAAIATGTSRGVLPVDSTPPTLVSAVVSNSTPSRIDLTWNEPINPAISASSAFTVSAGHSLTAHTYVDSTHTYLTTSTAFVGGEAARTLAYTQPGTNNMKDLAGNLLANFSSATITNNVSSGSSAITPSMVVSRTSGYPPLAIHVDSTATTTSDSTRADVANGGAYLNVMHSYDFGQTGIGNHTQTGLPRNTQVGFPIAATIYRSVGTYNIVDTMSSNGTSSVTASATITVTDITAANTIVVNGTGTNDGTGPSGCTYQVGMPTASGCNGKRILIGSGMTVDIPNLTGSQWAHFKGLGSGANKVKASTNPWVLFQGNGSVNQTVFENISAHAWNMNGAGWTIVDDDCDQFLQADNNNTLLLMGTSDAYGSGAPNDNFNSWNNGFVFDSKFVSNTTTASLPAHCIYGPQAYGAVVNCLLGGASNHDWRSGGMHKMFLGHNRITGVHDLDVSICKFHASDNFDYVRGTTNGSGPFNTQYVNFADNILNSTSGAPSYASLGVEPQNDAISTGTPGNEVIKDFGVERNQFYIGNTGGSDINRDGIRISCIGNTRIGTGGAIGISIGHRQQVGYSGPFFTARL